MIDYFIEEGDPLLIPRGLVDICRDPIERLGQPEYVLLDSLLHDDSPPNVSASMSSVSVNADFEVYPNIAEPTQWWRLGNMKTDGVDAIIKAYRDETTPGMRMNREIRVSKLAQRYGNESGKKLYDKSDLVCRWLHQWGVDYVNERG